MEESICCVCYIDTNDRMTLCKHSLCNECDSKLNIRVCPICSIDLKYIIRNKCFNCGIQQETVGRLKVNYPIIYNCSCCKTIKCSLCERLLKTHFYAIHQNYDRLQEIITTDDKTIDKNHIILLCKDVASVHKNKYYHLRCYRNHLKLK